MDLRHGARAAQSCLSFQRIDVRAGDGCRLAASRRASVSRHGGRINAHPGGVLLDRFRGFGVIADPRRLLAAPALFDFYQAAVGANNAKQLFVSEWLQPATGDRILDIGCGTGAVVPFLPEDVQTTGVDISSAYIAAAKNRFGSRATFMVGDAADLDLYLGGDFDVAYAFGVLHHLPDTLAQNLIEGAILRLRPGGRFVSIDPTIAPGQGWASRFIVNSDRGRYVRSPEKITELFGDYTPRIEVRTDLLRIPFANVIAVFIRP